MLFSPLSEIAYIGRNPPYIFSTILFVVVSILLATIGDMSFAGLMTMRFLQGFFGSPVLASGGASLLDIYDWHAVPYAFILWIGAMYCGPAIGPLLAANAVGLDWRWPLWQICIMTAPIALCAIPLLPETSHPKILYLRAQRLRKQTGNPNYKSQTELVKLDTTAHFLHHMNKPLEIAILDPAVTFVCIYGALLYATYYSFFEALLLVYVGIYKFALVDFGTIFLCVVIGCIGFAIPYALYVYLVVGPQARRTDLVQEARLKPALPAAFLLPASLFLFAWTAREDIHWIVPTIGVAIFSGTSFVVVRLHPRC
jgi:DHA1 family multidrug resistance protein-like MFS transporter